MIAHMYILEKFLVADDHSAPTEAICGYVGIPSEEVSAKQICEACSVIKTQKSVGEQ